MQRQQHRNGICARIEGEREGASERGYGELRDSMLLKAYLQLSCIAAACVCRIEFALSGVEYI